MQRIALSMYVIESNIYLSEFLCLPYVLFFDVCAFCELKNSRLRRRYMHHQSCSGSWHFFLSHNQFSASFMLRLRKYIDNEFGCLLGAGPMATYNKICRQPLVCVHYCCKSPQILQLKHSISENEYTRFFFVILRGNNTIMFIDYKHSTSIS